MPAYILGGITLLVLLTILVTAVRHPHLRRMTFRNMWTRKTTAILTIIGSMTGTALITSALLLQTSMDRSVDRVFEQQFGRIVSDMPAAGQSQLKGPYFTLDDTEKLLKSGKQFNSDLEAVLPTVSLETTILRLDGSGRPLLLAPKTYIHGFDPIRANAFDARSAALIPPNLGDTHIVLSEPAAQRLEVKAGDMVTVMDSNRNRHAMNVIQVVPQAGLTGYKGVDKARFTAIVSEKTAKKLSGIDSGYNHLLVSMKEDADERVAANFGPEWKTEAVRATTMLDLKSNLKLLPVFLVASTAAIIIGMVLIINIFKMLVEERRQEMGILRAIGMNRRDLARLLRMEGALYAVVSGIFGMLAGIGLANLLLLGVGDLFRTMSEYSYGVTLSFAFSLDTASLIIGVSIGILLILICTAAVARKAARVSIVEALQPVGSRINGEQRTANRRSFVRTARNLFIMLLTLGLLLTVNTAGYNDWAAASSVEPLIHFAAGFILVLLLTTLFITWLRPMLVFVQHLFRPFPKASAMLKLAFRYPEVNRTRTGLLVFMFALVLFLTGFSGVFGKTMSHYFGGFDARAATGGFDLLATTPRDVSTDELNEMLQKSENVGKKWISSAVTLASVDTSEGFAANGIDHVFASATRQPLVERDPAYADDRSAWLATAGNPELIIISRHIAPNVGGQTYGVGDMYPVTIAGHTVKKKVVALADYKNENYQYLHTHGIWMSKEALQAIVKDPRSYRHHLLIRVAQTAHLAEAAKGIEKTLILENIYPLMNPVEYFIAGSSFVSVFFSLFEGFSGLASLISIAGLMVVLLRVIHERRQQIGMLRAIGVPSRLIYGSILIEGCLIGMTGIILGLLMGSYTGHAMVMSLFRGEGDFISGFTIQYPYFKLALYTLGALTATFLSTMIPARRTLSTPPAEATRYAG